MAGVDVRLDDRDAAGIQPADESAHGFGGVPVALPVQADHPGDLGPPAGVRDGRLDVADRCPPGSRRMIQFRHSSLPSGERPAAWRAYRARNSSRPGGDPPVKAYRASPLSTPTISSASVTASGVRERRPERI